MSLNNYLEQLRKKNRYDPRQDLKSDSWLWILILKTAERYKQEIYNLLHYFRCTGCRLVLRDDKLELRPTINQGSYYHLEDEWKKERREWLLPQGKDIKKIFAMVEKYLKENEGVANG